ncbi:hypothetical protein OS122_09775 [Mycolicibacterium mucogenicum]|uniref:hypothetical protein n=1 Tax=Mycolicibacterium mucogenicum TaxID=56689 RepID=UPI00226A5A2F|nr:hypothetical protein [Mycolicibacterium mucogenicum]MCX8561170.1 hypothetical protein [Mycolicibacterium mucogenicum]
MARLNVAGAVTTAGVVVFGFVGAVPLARVSNVDVSAVRVAAINTSNTSNTSLAARWAALDQFIAAAAQFGAAAAIPTAGTSAGRPPATPIPLASTYGAPTSGPAGPTPLAATPTPLAGIPIISDIGSAIGAAFWSFVGPLVNNSVVGPFFLVGAIFFGIFVVAPIMYVVESVQQFFAPLFGLLPAAASPAAAKTVASTAAVPGPTAIAADAVPTGSRRRERPHQGAAGVHAEESETGGLAIGRHRSR